MAISKKGKRRITVNGVKYLWWVLEIYDQTVFDGWQVKIIAEDQSIYFQYGFEHNYPDRYLIISLNQTRYKVHVLCPKFEQESALIKPGEIAKLIDWALRYPDAENPRIISHAYSSQHGIIEEEKRLETLYLILDELHNN